ncbi:MAG: hypothetical protein FJW37_15055, partial [Acidobacteria bacterium]|nr:hypothetical protein [Acidobacteriota bacterium]
MLSTNLGDPPKGWALFVDLYRRDVAGDQSKWERFCDALLNGKIENQVFSEADGGLNPVPARVWRRRNVRRQEHSLFQTGVIKVAQNLHDVDA